MIFPSTEFVVMFKGAFHSEPCFEKLLGLTQMRRMYGLLTYMKGETWPYSRETGLVNIPCMDPMG